MTGTRGGGKTKTVPSSDEIEDKAFVDEIKTMSKALDQLQPLHTRIWHRIRRLIPYQIYRRFVH